MGKVELMQEKIAQQRKLPNDIKEKLNLITFQNLLISILIMIYIVVVNLLFMNETAEVFSKNIRVSAITLAIIDIIIFEVAYRKESVPLAIHGIELFCFSVFVLSIPYIYFYLDPMIRNLIMLSSVFLAIYYVGKTIVIHIIETNKYINNLSDVLEILKDDSEEQSYLDDYEISEEQVVSEIQEMKEKTKIEKNLLKSKKSKSKKEGEKND